MAIFVTLLKVLVRIDSRLVTMTGLLQLLVDHHKGLQQVLVQPTWLDNQDVMQKLKISESTLKRHRLSGVIRSSRIGGKYYYKESDIQLMLQRGMGK